MELDKLTGFLRQKFHQYFYEDEWNIGIINKPIEEVFNDGFRPQIKWIKLNNNDIFLADPFAYGGSGVPDHIICERYKYNSRKGDIVCVKLDKNFKVTEIREVLHSFFHLSYPFIFKYDNEIYCVPEVANSNTISLFRAVDYPNKWEKVKDLIVGIPALDTTLFQHQGRWWMCFTQLNEDQNKALYVYHSDKLDGEWTAHTNNPVKHDVASTRPAGTPFAVNGKLYRPSQDCSKTYGGAIVVNEILELTPTTFREQEVKRFMPDPESEYNLGMHTLSGFGNYTLIDGKKRKFSMIKPFYLLLFKLRLKMNDQSGAANRPAVSPAPDHK